MSEIQRFYAGQNVFITGGTGFMGKILLEKLLRSFPNLGNIYLLTRQKKGKKSQERVKEITSLPIFEPLREKNPNIDDKIIPINGDATKPGLGLSPADRALIIEEVSIVIHAAATTRFDERFEVAVAININSLLDIVDICRECKKLKVAVYLSTAFSQCLEKYIEEKIYPGPMTHEEITNTVQIIKRRNLSSEDEEKFTQILLGRCPNTYVFTKAIAEEVLNERAKDLPFCIFRFPIVSSTYKEPMPGWVDTPQGFNLSAIGTGIGAIRAVNCSPKATFHLVPADLACNALIVTAYDASFIKTGPNDELPVYNYASGTSNCLTWGSYAEITRTFRTKCPPASAFYHPDAVLVQSTKVYAIIDFFLHLLPALLGDSILWILGKKPMIYDIYKRGHKLNSVLNFFTLWYWTFETDRVDSMWRKLPEADKEMFPFDLATVDWADILLENWRGILKYLLNEDMSPEGREKAGRWVKKLTMIHRIVQVSFATLIIWLVWRLFS